MADEYFDDDAVEPDSFSDGEGDDSDFNTDDRPEKRPDLQTTLTALRDSAGSGLTAALFYGLSGITRAEADLVRAVWEDLDREVRETIMQRMVDLSETNIDLEYREMGLIGLDDESSGVRQTAIALLWEDESSELLTRLIDMAQWDESSVVRAAATSALGSFILLGEMGELPDDEFSRVQDVVVSIYSNINEEIDVRRRALESIANSSHELVSEAITEAYHSDDPLFKTSAVFAMGRTCDEQWADIIMRELRSEDPAMRYEAARASGELELPEAVPYLAVLAHESDREIKEAAIWSLGEIGSNQAVTVLSAIAEQAEEEGDDDLLEMVEEAIGSATLANLRHDLDFGEEL